MVNSLSRLSFVFCIVTLGALVGCHGAQPASSAAASPAAVQVPAENGGAGSSESAGSLQSPEGAFSEKVANGIRSKRKDVKVDVVEPLKLALTFQDGSGRKAQADLGRAWRRCERDQTDCDAAATWAVDGFVSAMGTPDTEQAEQLRVVLRPQADMDVARKVSATIVAEPWLGKVWIVLAFDLPQTIRLAMESDLVRLKLGRDKAMQIARENTARALANGKPVEMGPVWAFTGNAYDASRLLVGTDWAALKKTVKGELLVAMPAKNLVLFTGTKDKFGHLAQFGGLAAHMFEVTDFPLSSSVLKWTPKGFQVATE